MHDPRFPDATILIVDDQPANVLLLTRILERHGFQAVHGTTNPLEVDQLVAGLQPDLIVLDLHMPRRTGFEILADLRELVPEDTFLPVLVLTADITPETKEHALSAGARDFLTKPFDATETLLRISNLLETRYLHLRLQRHNAELERLVRERTRDLEAAHQETLERLAIAAEFRDDATGGHIRRVEHMAGMLATYCGLPGGEVEMIRKSAPLHDIGKIGIPDSILLKPGRLTAEEFAVMRTHTVIGAQMLSGSIDPLLTYAEEIARSHHERWDGAGYPDGRVGGETPLPARIVAVADVFDALISARPYKEPWPLHDAVAEIVRQRGRQFDPLVVDAFETAVRDRAIDLDTPASTKPARGEAASETVLEHRPGDP